MIRATLRKELVLLWASPVPYVVGALFHAALGVLAVDVLRAREQAVFQPLVPITGFLLLVMVPPLTMRAFADEYRHGTLDLLLAVPVRPAALVIGKWLATSLTVVVLAAPAALHAVLLTWWGEPDTAPMRSGVIGLFLLVLAACALGGLVSAATTSQPIAALGAFFVLLVGWLLQPTTDSVALRGLTGRLSLSERVRTFAAGGIERADLTFFVVLIVVCLAATVVLVDLRPHRLRSDS